MAEAEEQQPEVQEPQRPDPSAEIARNKMDEAFWDVKNQRIKQETLAQNQVENLQKQKEAYQEKVPGITGAIQEREKALEPIYQQQAPTLPQPPKLQNFLNKDVATMLLGVGSVIAGLNSSGRARGIRANKSLAAGINGYVNGNFEMAKMGLEDWKNQVDTQLNEYKLIRQNNMDILNARGLSIEDKTLELELAMKPHGFDQKMFDVRQNAIDNALKFDKELADITYKTQLAAAKVDPILQGLRLQQMQLGLERAGLGVEKAQLDLEKARTTKPGDDKPAGPGNYFDKLQGKFIPNIPTRGEVRDDQDRFVRMSNEDKRAVEFLYSALDELPELERLAGKVLPTSRSAVPMAYFGSKTSRYTPGQHAQEVTDFKQRAAALQLQATRLETGTSRVLGAVLAKVADQIPDPVTNRDNAIGQIKTLRDLIRIRLNSFLGTRGEGNFPPGMEQTQKGPPSGIPPENTLHVKDKKSGKPGWIPPNEFNDVVYERLP